MNNTELHDEYRHGEEASYRQFDKLEFADLYEVSFYSIILHLIDLAIAYEPFFISSILT